MGTEQLPAIRGLYEHTTAEFRDRLVAIGAELDIPPEWLAAVMSFETAGTYDPTARPYKDGVPLSSAVGLLQWTDGRAATLGLTTEQIADMSQLEQLEVVRQTYEKAPQKLLNPRQTYLWVFAPTHINDEPGDAVYSAPTKSYYANAALDRDGDGVITASEASEPVYELLIDAGVAPPPEPGAKGSRWLVALLGALAAGAGCWLERRRRV